MRQIGARWWCQVKMGGIGSWEELCCSTWLTDFKSVSTGAARYQNRRAKLSEGQCRRLKCCLNYGLDTLPDALRPSLKDMNVIQTKNGKARLSKTDIFRQKLWCTIWKAARPGYHLPLDKIAQIRTRLQNGEANWKGLMSSKKWEVVQVVEKFADVTGGYFENAGKASIKSARRTAIKSAATNDRKRTIRKIKTDRTRNERWQQAGETGVHPAAEPRNRNKRQNRMQGGDPEFGAGSGSYGLLG